MQRILNKKSAVWDYIMVIIGTGLLATSIKCLYDPMGLVTGGFTGLCIVIKEVTEGIVDGGIPLWLSNLILNIPLFLIAWKVKGKRFIWRTIIGTFLLSAWIYVIPAVDLTQQDYFLVAVFGGCIGRNGTDPAWKGDHRRHGDGGGIAAAFFETLFRCADHAGVRCHDRAFWIIYVWN